MSGDDDFTPDEDSLDPQVRGWLDAAYAAEVDVETAARHLWRIHREADTEPILLPDVLEQRSEPLVAVGVTPEGSVSPESGPPRRARRSLVAVLSAVFMFATSGIAVAASGGSLPGDVLYPVKLSAERAQLVLTIGAERDAQLHLRFAQKRLEEASAVVSERPERVPRLLVAAVDAADRAERLGGSSVSASAAEVRQATGTALTSIAGVVDASRSAELTQLRDRLGLTTVALEETAPETPGSARTTTPRVEPPATVTPPRVTEDPPVRATEAPPSSEPSEAPTTATSPPTAAERPAPRPIPQPTAEPAPAPADGPSAEQPSAEQPSAEQPSEGQPPEGETEPPAEGDEPQEPAEDAEGEPPPEDEGAKRRPGMDELAGRFEDR